MYGTQTGMRPPRFRVFVNSPRLITRDYGYWVENELRARFGWRACRCRSTSSSASEAGARRRGRWRILGHGVLGCSATAATRWRSPAAIRAGGGDPASGHNPRYLTKVDLRASSRARSTGRRSKRPSSCRRGPEPRLRRVVERCPATRPSSLTKGLDPETGARLSTLVRDRPVAVLSGPNIAEEIAQGLPAAAVVASEDRDARRAVAARDQLDDVPGVRERGHRRGGALRRGEERDRARRGRCRRPRSRRQREGGARHARPGRDGAARGVCRRAAGDVRRLAGMGDLIVTCWSPSGRNRRAGELIARARRPRRPWPRSAWSSRADDGAGAARGVAPARRRDADHRGRLRGARRRQSRRSRWEAHATRAYDRIKTRADCCKQWYIRRPSGRGRFAVIAAAALGLLVASAALAGVIQGTVRNDTLKGAASTDVVHGKGGNDKLYGLAGNDKLYGDSGNDKIEGGAGNDTVYGGAGDDTLVGGAGNDTLVGGTGKDRFDCGPGRDSVSASAIDVVGSGCEIYNGSPVGSTPAPPPTPAPTGPMALPGLYCGFTDQGPGICLTVTADSKGVTTFRVPSIIDRCSPPSAWQWTLSLGAVADCRRPEFTTTSPARSRAAIRLRRTFSSTTRSRARSRRRAPSRARRRSPRSPGTRTALTSRAPASASAGTRSVSRDQAGLGRRRVRLGLRQ